MKAMSAPRLPHRACRARKPIFLDHKQVYFSNFCSRFYILYSSSCKLERMHASAQLLVNSFNGPSRMFFPFAKFKI